MANLLRRATKLRTVIPPTQRHTEDSTDSQNSASDTRLCSTRIAKEITSQIMGIEQTVTVHNVQKGTFVPTKRTESKKRK
jgi:hypothetical protein